MNSENIYQPDDRIKIGFTHGDVNGIGYEIIIKTLIDNQIIEMITPVVFGISKVASYHRKTLKISDFNFNLIKRVMNANPKRANIINIYDREVKIELGHSTSIAGKMAFRSLESAIDSINKNEIDAIVTAPINKKNIQSDDFHFPGHTEYFAKKYDVKDYLMLMVSKTIRVGVVTGHLPIKEVAGAFSEELILKKIKIMHHSLQRDFGLERPKIALLGLNPHAGDNGLIGNEEQEIIYPAIKKAFDEGMLVFGPYPSDGFFGAAKFKQFDGVLAMYHDQCMVPFKILSFDDGVNFTAGLPIIRTSPSHGTAYDIAGKDVASESSMRAAVYLACDIIKNRKLYDSMYQNPLKTTEIIEEK